MVTKATRDVIDVRTRAITDGIDIDGDCGANFSIDGVPIGLTTPCDGAFVNLSATNLTVTGTIDGTGATVIGDWQATYSDIAECYEADKDYKPGTVVKIGGDKEITASDRAVDEDVFGVVSTQPAYVLNACREGDWLPVVLVGRVPVRVVGPVKKGERLVTSNIAGVARAVKDSEKGCKVPTFGRVLKDDGKDEERLVEVAFVTLR